MFDEQDKVQKRKIEVEVKLNDGTKLMGALFVHAQQRLSDLLNDQRQFLPLQTSGGVISNLSKSYIYQVTQLDQRVELDESDDPYEILGVMPTIPADELKDAYRKLCADNHPDRLQAMGLSGDFVDLANTRMARINDAYSRILAERSAGAKTNGAGAKQGAASDPF
ncbi:MAG: J domain-containing protein [Pseudomonadota bacterium]